MKLIFLPHFRVFASFLVRRIFYKVMGCLFHKNMHYLIMHILHNHAQITQTYSIFWTTYFQPKILKLVLQVKLFMLVILTYCSV